MKYYTCVVPFDVAKKLKEAGYPQSPGLNYYQIPENMPAAGYVGNPENYDYEQFWEYHDKIYTAPTYADVVDWLLDRGIFVQMEPWHTFALMNRMGFVYTINTLNEEDAKINREIWNDFASFHLCMDSAIIRALELIEKATE